MGLEIFGVDFSGAAPDKNTWIASATLVDGGLELRECFPASRNQVADLLLALPAGSVAALDFPFSVPLPFAEYWTPGAEDMTQLWTAAAAMESAEFMKLRDDFVAQHGEPKREIDKSHTEAYSCLHKANPNMVPMTFRGMQMLARLWTAGCDVPPLPSQNAGKAVLLEVMPGAVLRSLGLPFKGYKNGKRRLELRRTILDSLPELSPVGLPNLQEFREACMSSHDCLDAVVAALAAALWSIDPGIFRLPSADGDPEDPLSLPGSVLRLEGWLYAPINSSRTGPVASTAPRQ
jgi:hypothetical protein